MKTDASIIAKMSLCNSMVNMLKNINFKTEKDEFIFSRTNGRFLFSTKDIEVAYAYLTGICNERVGLS